MMRALVGIALCTAACAFDHGRLPGDDDSGTGSGSTGDPDQDNDGDGVADLADNCDAIGNADQRDHDDDGRGDSCDGCPHLIDTASDSDGDGVGNACDPNPAKAGDRIAFFEGFYEEPSWKRAIGGDAWVPVDGTLRQPNVDSQYQLVRDDNPDLAEVFVDARVRVNALSMNVSMRRSSGVVLSYRDPNHYLFCGLAATVTQGAEVNAGEVFSDFFGTHYDYDQGAFPAAMAGDWLTLQARTTQTEWGTRIECVSHRSGATGSATHESGAEVQGDVGIRTNGADTSFDYVFVVATSS